MSHSRYFKPSPLPSNSLPCCLLRTSPATSTPGTSPIISPSHGPCFLLQRKGNFLYFPIYTHKFTSGCIHGTSFPQKKRGHSKQILYSACKLLFLQGDSSPVTPLPISMNLLLSGSSSHCLYIYSRSSLSYTKKCHMFLSR